MRTEIEYADIVENLCISMVFATWSTHSACLSHRFDLNKYVHEVPYIHFNCWRGYCIFSSQFEFDIQFHFHGEVDGARKTSDDFLSIASGYGFFNTIHKYSSNLDERNDTNNNVKYGPWNAEKRLAGLKITGSSFDLWK